MAKKKKLLLLPLRHLLLLLLTPLLPLLLLLPPLTLLLPPQLLLLPLQPKARRSNSSRLKASALHWYFSKEKARQLAGFFFWGLSAEYQRISGARI